MVLGQKVVTYSAICAGVAVRAPNCRRFVVLQATSAHETISNPRTHQKTPAKYHCECDQAHYYKQCDEYSCPYAPHRQSTTRVPIEVDAAVAAVSSAFFIARHVIVRAGNVMALRWVRCVARRIVSTEVVRVVVLRIRR